MTLFSIEDNTEVKNGLVKKRYSGYDNVTPKAIVRIEPAFTADGVSLTIKQESELKYV